VLPRVWCQNEISVRKFIIVSFLIRQETKFYLGVQSARAPKISVVKGACGDQATCGCSWYYSVERHPGIRI